MFGCIFIVVWDNAIKYEAKVLAAGNPYRWIAVRWRCRQL